MTRHNAANERIKRIYFSRLKDAKGRDEASIDSVAKSLNRFEVYTKHRDFKRFHIEQAKAFKAVLMDQRNERTGAPLSASTIASTLGNLKSFFQWLGSRDGYNPRISFDAEYFNPPDKLARIAAAHREKRVATIEEIRTVVGLMPKGSETELRDRALIAFAIVTGARDGAIITFKLKHIDIAARLLLQDPREVNTKGSKTFSTWFFPVGEDFIQGVADWVAYLRDEKGYGDHDPIFPSSEVENPFDPEKRTVLLSGNHWTTAAHVRALYKEAFARAGLPYANPHCFRDSLVQRAYALKLDAEAFKAWSQNLGHESCLTTFSSYGTIRADRQAEIMAELAKPKSATSDATVSLQELQEFIATRKGQRG